MEDARVINSVELRGILGERPTYSHTSRNMNFFMFPLEVQRLSGVADRVHVIVREELLQSVEIEEAPQIWVSGELRSFNNKSGVGSKLLISVYAHALGFSEGEDINRIHLEGCLCKAPNYRTTPMGREICDLLLAVNRRYGRSDYLPCIAWGMRAREAATWPVGTAVAIDGRLQSRQYIKNTEDDPETRTAFEVSIMEIESLGFCKSRENTDG